MERAGLGGASHSTCVLRRRRRRRRPLIAHVRATDVPRSRGDRDCSHGCIAVGRGSASHGPVRPSFGDPADLTDGYRDTRGLRGRARQPNGTSPPFPRVGEGAGSESDKTGLVIVPVMGG